MNYEDLKDFLEKELEELKELLKMESEAKENAKNWKKGR